LPHNQFNTRKEEYWKEKLKLLYQSKPAGFFPLSSPFSIAIQIYVATLSSPNFQRLKNKITFPATIAVANFFLKN